MNTSNKQAMQHFAIPQKVLQLGFFKNQGKK
jgi:hypothetical protein